MKTLKIFTFCLLFITVFTCKNDDDNSISDSNPNTTLDVFTENFGSEINRDFLGQVIDQNENPIDNVTITIGNQTTLTDANGVFIVRDANIYERFGYVKAEKAGYIHGSRSVVPTSGTNKVTIMLLEETIVGTTSSGISETIALTNGASVALEGDYIKEDGSAYSGSVNVIIHHLDPVDENMPYQMPGMLYAANAQNEERMLQTFGMLAVELRGSNGEDLNLATGTTAEITVPLDASLLANAPATIPLWYFDEAAGYWKEDGEATLVGNAYVGIVSHFSFWNCDIPAEAVTLCVNVMNDDGNALSNVSIRITSDVYGRRNGYTNENGQACGLVPMNEVLSIDITYYFPNGCSSGSTSTLYDSTIGPFSSDDSIDIIIDDNSTEWITESINGFFNDCNENAVTEGYVYLFTETGNYSQDLSFVRDGNFELSTVRCSNSSNIFRLKGTDYVNIQETDTISFTYTSPLTNVGTILACNSVEEFITYQVDDHQVITYNLDISSGVDNYFYVSHQLPGSNSNFSMAFPGNVGVFNSTAGAFINATDANGDNFDIETISDFTVNCSSFGDVDEYVDATFSGSYSDTSGNHTFTGTIHVIRDY